MKHLLLVAIASLLFLSPANTTTKKEGTKTDQCSGFTFYYEQKPYCCDTVIVLDYQLICIKDKKATLLDTWRVKNFRVPKAKIEP